MTALYNELDPFAASWLRNLIAAGHIAPGAVDERSIQDLTPADVAGPGQRHFFAGIGGWSYALRLAGIPDNADVWTGSCPCQPFSSAGKRSGTSDPRHLWPTWFALIEECRPPVIFGEQVASIDGLAWLDSVYSDLERCGYAVGAADLCAAGVGAPHIRQRLYFVAYAGKGGLPRRGAPWIYERRARTSGDESAADSADGTQRDDATRRCSTLELGDADSLAGRRNGRAVSRAEGADESVRSRARRSGDASEDLDQSAVADAGQEQRGRRPSVVGSAGENEAERQQEAVHDQRGSADGFWSDTIWIDCADGKRRPVSPEPALFPLADGVLNRVGLLRGSGNAIVPQVAAAFIQAASEAVRKAR